MSTSTRGHLSCPNQPNSSHVKITYPQCQDQGIFVWLQYPIRVYQREDDCLVHWRAPLLGESRWMKLTYSLTEAAWINLCLFHLELYFSSTGPQWMQLMTNLRAVEVIGTWVAKFRVVSLHSPSERMYYFRCPALISLSTKQWRLLHYSMVWP